MKLHKPTYVHNTLAVLLILCSLFSCETTEDSATKDTIFIGLIVLEIAFVAFVFIIRYVTRNDQHHEEEEAEDHD